MFNIEFAGIFSMYGHCYTYLIQCVFNPLKWSGYIMYDQLLHSTYIYIYIYLLYNV